LNLILDRLLAISGRLELLSGVPANALASLREFLAASLIEENPDALPIQPDSSVDAAINEAAARGALLAAKLVASGTRIRVRKSSHLATEVTPDRPTHVFGPLVDADGSLVQFAVFESARFLAVQLTRPAPLPLFSETLMLLPDESSSDDGNRTFSIPPGTVWLRARFLVGNTAGYVGLRVKSGTLKIDRAAQPMPANRIGITPGSKWSLALEPEQPPVPDGNGSDGNGIAVRLPDRFDVFSTGVSQVNGIIAISGFGSDLEFADTLGAPSANADAITFPYDAGDALFSIDGNLSNAAQFTGECRVVAAGWTLPVNKLPLNTFGEAVHGGSLKIRLREGLKSRLRGAAGGFTWFGTVLTANGSGVSLDALQAACSARSELDLWTPAHTDAVFSKESLEGLFFTSLRDGRDVAVVRGGQLRNRWDLPLTAANKPFSYEGQIDLFGLIAEPTGRWRVACAATQQSGNDSHGVALENLYLTVRAPRRLAFTGDYDGVSVITDGIARFFFDVILAQPTLPDPYITNRLRADGSFIAESALSVTLRWANLQTPHVEAQLEGAVAFASAGDLPADETPELRRFFDRHLESHVELLHLLDLSSNDHHFGVSLERLSDHNVQLRENRLTVELRGVRLLMQPQVQWEPVDVVPNDDAGVPNADTLVFKTNGARTLAGAASVQLVPVLPGIVSLNFVTAASQRRNCGVLFSLPFGLRAFARIAPLPEQIFSHPIVTTLHEPKFGELTSARQLRLVATGVFNRDPLKNPASRSMTGAIEQLPNLESNLNKLASVLSSGIDKNGVPILTAGLDTLLNNLDELPLHHADLSGYGLSTFSNWHRDVPSGITKVRFDVLNGRTSYEVIQARTVLAFPLCSVVRTVIFERRNSGKVLRFDSGWQSVNDGEFKLVSPALFEFEKGVVKAFRNIRRIRLLSDPPLNLSDSSSWQPVIFDADAHLESVVAGGAAGLVPIYDHPGYIQIAPTEFGSEVTRDRIVKLLKKVGKAVGGGIDCRIRLGETLEMNLSGIFADEAPHEKGPDPPALMLAAYGLPKLPRAGQWSAVRINSSTSEASPVDPRHGMPVVKRTGQPKYIFRDPGDVNLSKPDDFGFLMSTATSRVLFPEPSVSDDPLEKGKLLTEPPFVADPYSLVQATSQFPRPTYALRCVESPLFNISDKDEWRLTNPDFNFILQAADLAKGGEWDMKRGFVPSPKVTVILDSAIQNKPWEISADPTFLDLNIEGFGTVFTIHGNYNALSGSLPQFENPTLDFGQKLKPLKDLINSLEFLKDLIDFPIGVEVNPVPGPSPTFVVIINLKLRIGEGPNERIDIGLGKFCGEFIIRGELETGLSGKTRGLLSAEFQGDMQQGIIPPAIYAGGFFRFAIQIDETGKPTIELGFATVTSIGGDLIKGLLEVEVTVKYGYMLIPQNLEPGVILGLEARAKLLGGLVGFSFSVETLARIQRIKPEANEVTIWAQIRVCATVHVAWLIDEDIDVNTQFEQELPLTFVLAALFGPALLPVAAVL
jgi:hypothetical protein